MSSSEPKSGERVRDVRVTDDAISVDLFDGRTITVPLAWYPRLLHASPEERANWRITGAGYGIHWPDLDEDLTTRGLLQGAPASRGRIYLVEKKGRVKTIGRFKKLRGAATVKMTNNEIMALTRGK